MSKHTRTDLYEKLKSIFHNPKRLAIMSALCNSTVRGMSFRELKTECYMTDGNLNRHLCVLEEAEMIAITKTFIKRVPRTTIYISDMGIEYFNSYLESLAEVLVKAKQAVSVADKSQRLLSLSQIQYNNGLITNEI
ncbi:MAG: transcriptional regulator [Victivallaceae bacterium]|nr:transcriptional regulator [Victivallaceae bacterium]